MGLAPNLRALAGYFLTGFKPFCRGGSLLGVVELDLDLFWVWA